MRYELVPVVEGTEGRITEFGIKNVGILLDVSRRTYTYERIDGEFRRLPEQWVAERRNFADLPAAVGYVLEGLYSVPGLLDGDVFLCDFEGMHYEWTLSHNGDGSFFFHFQKNPME